ncbi:hypothetical protein Q4E93_24835 [Flavitalea sp. BT771]|uniref:hypothetical protein n=1 Tax=Flavitalea sp. BT771 TaxID=3063329 RepID=UPI0026E11CA8|nr:hypothetical protein [Flavitalea sp. BT771]MDO6433856.1 hypothetical protein [Flavitalea sp. BT771]MDV6222239.1 hypothetical protein [Flavitalea sp. BT771]
MRTTYLLPLASLLFGIPWIIFGIQHFLYADFVRGLVPAYMPARIFWVYLTCVAMIAAGISFILRRQVRLAAFLLGCMLLLFILMVHPLLLSGEPQGGIHWTRALQDTAIMAAAFGLCLVYSPHPSSPKASIIVKYCYALPLMVLGAQHFTHNAFVTAKIPAWFPLIDVFDYLIGIALIAAALGILFTRNAHRTAVRLGVLLMILLILHHIPLLAANIHNAIEWTGAMLDLALAAGAFIVAQTADL